LLVTRRFNVPRKFVNKKKNFLKQTKKKERKSFNFLFKKNTQKKKNS